MSSWFSRRNFLKGSLGLAAISLVDRWTGHLWAPRAAADTGQVVMTEHLRLRAGELAGGRLAGVRVGDGRLTLAASGSGEYVSPVLLSPFPATHGGVHWRGSGASFWLRGSADGVTWSEWQPVIEEHGHGRQQSAETFGALIRLGRARHLQFRARLEDGKGPAEIESVTVTVLNAEDGRLTSPLAVAALAAPSTKPLNYPREAWGANEALRFNSGGEIWPRDYVPTKKAVVHHTATGNAYTDGAAEVRATYTYHAVTQGWGDIGYCWLIDKFGNAYEGRRGRDGEQVSEDVVAGHSTSFNHGSSGIALLGTFESVSPSSAALDKLREVLAWECSRHGMNPQASTDFLKADDTWRLGLPNVCGHRDTGFTACPGNSLYALLPGLRNDTASRLANSSAPTVAITSAPAEGTRTDRNVSYAWQGSGGSGAKQYSYYLEGWSLDSNVLVVYESGFNAAREPAWGPWTTATQAAYTLRQPGHYTFHVQAMDSLGQVSVYQDSRTLLADVTPMGVAMSLDVAGVRQPFPVGGWAIDQAAASGTGVDAVHVWAYPSNASGVPTGAPVFLGAAAYGGSRPDVGALYGEQFRDSGYSLSVTGLPVGFHHLVVYARSTVTGLWKNERHLVFQVP